MKKIVSFVVVLAAVAMVGCCGNSNKKAAEGELPPLPLRPKLRLAQTAPRSAIRRLHAAPRSADSTKACCEKSCCEKAEANK